MNMRVIEAGHGKMAAEIDDLSLRAFELLNVRVGADRDDFATSDGDGLDLARNWRLQTGGQRRV